MQGLAMLLAPLMMFGLLARTGVAVAAPEFAPSGLVTAFLDGHRGRRRPDGEQAPRG